jgi:hypothetical protein
MRWSGSKVGVVGGARGSWRRIYSSIPSQDMKMNMKCLPKKNIT